jgi:hypothetical protein
VRSVGASLGSQVTAAVLAASAIGAGLPHDSGYTEAFLVGSGVALLAAITAALIPSRSGRMAQQPAPATQAA